MENHFKLSDTKFEEQFANCRFDPEDFSHEAHLRLVWIHVKKYGIDKAELNIQTQLKKYVEHLGAIDKYNKTLTIASIKIVHHFMSRSPLDRFEDFIMKYPRLKYDFKELIGAHYEIDIYNSEIAKKMFIEPDVLPFDKISY